jgi:hypothetical protein
MAILRWMSVDDLLMYARMNNPERAEWVLKSMSQNVDSTVAAHLPNLDANSWVAALQSSMGDLEMAAMEAERTGELCEVSNN